jgi:methionyl-tRNA formyltransferase
MGANLLVETLAQIAAGAVLRQPQVGPISLAPKITKEMAAITWQKSAREIFNFVRGMNPAPGAFTTWRGSHLKIFRTRVLDDVGSGHEAGAVVQADERKGEVVVQAGMGHLAIDELQIEGKRRMSAAEFLRGHQVITHEKLG